ncbi:uncharacterized protein LOC124276937 [Haliotis rubra]|uniref:uncharacterized protein LOC124276937 n=1 Tax=Haliotis rubra TaxID=36100 RepID=UPI001EE5957C|nr:uncharacterized protein LOC124276937 [Haliotis rubra]
MDFRFSTYFKLQPIEQCIVCPLRFHLTERPEFNETPYVTVDLLDKPHSSELLFRCNFTRANERLFYKTTWYLEGAPFYTFEPTEWNSDDFDYIANTTLTEQLLRQNGVTKAGFNLQCSVQALYGPGQASSSGGLSEIQFVGVKIHVCHFGNKRKHGTTFWLREKHVQYIFISQSLLDVAR